MTVYRDEKRCQRCGGQCCKIYRELPDYIREGKEINNINFHKKEYSVKPFFDVKRVYVERDFNYISEIVEKGINPVYCEYWDKKIGCIIEWEERPETCKSFICLPWQKEIEGLEY